MSEEIKEVKNEENKQATKFEYINLYLINVTAAPVEGQSGYFVISQSDKRVVLLHPFTLTKFSINNVAFQEALMPTDAMPKEKIVAMLTRKRDAMKAANRKAPYTEVEEIIAHYSA
jgi:hypothetical protein